MVLIKLNMSGKNYFIVNLFILGFHVSLYIPVPFLSELKNTSFCVMSGQITIEVLRQNSSKKTFPLLRKTSFPKGQTVSFSIRIISPQTTRVLSYKRLDRESTDYSTTTLICMGPGCSLRHVLE